MRLGVLDTDLARGLTAVSPAYRPEASSRVNRKWFASQVISPSPWRAIPARYLYSPGPPPFLPCRESSRPAASRIRTSNEWLSAIAMPSPKKTDPCTLPSGRYSSDPTTKLGSAAIRNDSPPGHGENRSAAAVRPEAPGSGASSRQAAQSTSQKQRTSASATRCAGRPSWPSHSCLPPAFVPAASPLRQRSYGTR